MIEKFNYHIDRSIKHNAKRAFKLIDRGVWMTPGGGYYHKNENGCGYYFAYGEYPGCVRSCQEHTAKDIKSKGEGWYKVVIDE